MTEPVHDLGVLFVHGIGQQVQGGTLAQFGDPIAEWLGRWSGDGFTLDDTRLHPQDDAPAHSRLRSGDVSWLLAECHWADAIHEPTFRDLMKWAFIGVPWVLGAHFNGQMVLGVLHFQQKHYWQAFVRFARAAGASVLAALLIAGVAALFPLLFVFALIPVLRPALVSVQRLLSAVLGDSYLFVESPVQRSAIVSRFRRDLVWLLERAKRVAVVAHSQGAAVAYFGCKEWTPVIPGRFEQDPPADSDRIALVTFGSGLAKLQVLRGARAVRHAEEHGALFAWGSPAGLVAMAAAVYVLVNATWGTLPIALLLLLFGVLGLLAGSFLTAGAPMFLKETNGGLLEHARWTDITATRDLVSNISLSEFYATGATPEVIRVNLGLARLPDEEALEVENERSRLADHVSYFRNTDGFVSTIVSTLLRTAGQTLEHTSRRWRVPATEPVTTQRMSRTVARRKWRVQWRGYSGVAWAIVSLALLAWRGADFPADFVGMMRQQIGTFNAGPFTVLFAPVVRVALTVPAALTAATSACIVALVVLLVSRLSWSAWDVSDRWRFFDGADYALSFEFWLFATTTIVMLEALALVAIGWPLAPPSLSLFIAALPAMVESSWYFGRESRRTGALLTASEQGGLIAIARFGAAALVLWPLFTGLIHFGLDRALFDRLRLPAVSSAPPEFWIAVLLGWPVWFCFLAGGRRAMRKLRAWSASGVPDAPAASTAPDTSQDVAPQV